MLVEYYCEGKKKSVEVDNNKTKAKERKNEFILYTYLEKSPIENKDGEKMIAPSARDFYMASMESFFEEAKEQGLITSQETINPFNIGNVEFLNDILYNLQKDDEYKVVATSKGRNNRTTAFKHLLDFVENFEVPQIYLFNIKPSDNYWKKYPPEKWQLGINDNKIAYGESANMKKGDIALFKITGDIKAIRHIGRVYDIKKGTVYFEILARLKNDLTLMEMREVAGIENFHQNKLGKISEQQAALQLTIECFKQAEKDGLILNFTNKEQEMPNNNMQNKTAKNPPLNQILYGPPGTGKTYNTINKALEILGVETQGKSRAELKAQFDEFRQNGQIEFVTFHQSFSYEEFVEGIKPTFEKKNENEKTDKMEYEIADGVFKKICKAAQEIINLKKDFYPAFYKKLKKDGPITYDNITFEIDEKVTSEATNKEFKSGNITIYSSKLESILNNIEALDNEKLDDIIEQKITPEQQYKKDNIWRYKAIIRYYFDEYLPRHRHNYILIIDEINRGNISKILGELITLIEPSKRIGGDEELRVTLPYSNESFGVPSNLYIIGTMNTADRSIALLDTALRRRFEFVEMMPEPELLKNIWIVKDTEQRDNENQVIPENRIEELDKYMSEKSNCLYEILNSINNRIEFLLDREHTIGHAFFFEKAKFYKNDKLEWYELTLESLKEIFVKKIIPLLQEYFYDDYAKIDAVLNGNGMVKDFSKNDLQVNLSDDFVDSDKKIYCITKSSKWNEKNFLRIYDASVQIDKDE